MIVFRYMLVFAAKKINKNRKEICQNNDCSLKFNIIKYNNSLNYCHSWDMQKIKITEIRYLANIKKNKKKKEQNKI